LPKFFNNLILIFDKAIISLFPNFFALDIRFFFQKLNHTS
jgi:hypothetical protein